MFKPKYTWLTVAIAAATLAAACGDDSGSSSGKKDPAKTTCASNTDCKDDAKPFCNTETGVCEADPDSPDPNACPDGCPDNQTCVEGKCVDNAPEGCKADTDCKDASAPKCNTLTGKCEAAPEPDPNACPEGCPDNQKCVEGKCVDGNPCTGMDCEDGKACIPINATGVCLDVECVRDNAPITCDPGKVCQKGECVLEACAKVTCNQGKICQADGSCAFDSAPALVVDPIESKETSEAGGELAITLKLNHEPASDVSLKCEILSESPNPEAAALCDDVLFNAAHWNETQTVTLYGIADSIVDGDQAFELKITTVSDDPEFNGLTFSESFTNKDADKAGILVSRSEIQTSESGDKATFTVVLSSKPSANVTLTLASSKTEYGIIENAQENSLTLTFTPENWNVPQTVTVVGIEDDGSHNKTPNAYEITFSKSVSEDAHYNDIELPSVQATNLDNDKAEAFISVIQKQPCGNILPGEGDEPQIEDDPECIDGYKEVELDREFDENQLLVVHTDELNTVTHLRIRLGIAPTMPVELSITAWDDLQASSKTEAETEAVFSTSKLTFTKDNYKAGELLTISGKPDHIVDPDQPYYIRIRFSSDDDDYHKLAPIWIKCINANTDHFDFVKTTESANTVDEDSEINAEKPSVEYDISFACDPQDSVTVTFGIEDETELKVSPNTMTFTSENWNAPQKLKIDGKIDEIVDGDITSKITLKAKGENTAIETSDEIELTTVDINKAGINVAAVGGSYREGSDEVISFEVWLNAKPQDESVVVSLVSSNPSALSIVGNSTLVFTPENWDTHKQVTLKVGADVEENEYVRINLTSTAEEAAFNKLTAVTPDYIIIDTSGAAVSLTSAKTILKPGDYASTVDVSLSQDPMGTLTVTLLTTNDKTAAVEPKTLTFTSADWSVKQTVQVKVIDPNGAPSAKSVESISAITSASGPYNKVKPKKDVSFTIYQFLEKSFAYTGAVQTIDLKPGKYLFEVWGAQGSNAFATGGYGGYASGEFTIDNSNAGPWYVYVGGHTDTDQGGFNGGGGGNHTGGAAVYRGSGGGGSDIRNRKDDVKSRVIVAGGGGGSINYCGVPLVGAYGGGLASGPLMRQHLHATEGSNNIGADQTGTYVNKDPGVVCTSSVVPVNISTGSLGQGAQGGGGGYYGGAFYGSCNLIYTGAGGSGYIGGVQNGQMKSNVRTGHGAAKITLAE